MDDPKPNENDGGKGLVEVFAVDKSVLEGGLSGLVKEATAWDVYNNEAKKADDELVKDWRDNLNSLLLFAAIFAAVLSAFITESKKMLEQDQTQLLVNVMIFSINSMGNKSSLPFIPPNFLPSATSISINCLLFASLGTSLLAALAAVVSLQWVADYDAAITRGGSSPEDRALRRQFRYAGVVNWKMNEIIAGLPLLLYSSVALFWAGTSLWMGMLHPVVGYVMAGGAAVAVLFYVSTTVLGATYASSPFRTPLSRGIYWLGHAPILFVPRLLSPGHSIVIPRWIAWLSSRASVIPIRKYISSLSRHLHADPIIRWISTNLLPTKTSRQREDEEAKKDPSLTKQALAWLAGQITLSENSNRRLQLLMIELVKQSSKKTPSSTSFDASWWAIFDALGWHYLRKVLDGTLSENDHETVGVLVRCSVVPAIWGRISAGHGYESDPIKPAYWSQYCFGSAKGVRSREMKSINMTFLLARDVPVPSAGSKHELEATIQLIKWRNTEGIKEGHAWRDVFSNSGNYSPEYLKSYTVHLRVFLRHICQQRRYLNTCVPMWRLSRDKGVRHELLVSILESFDGFMRKAPSPDLRSTMVKVLVEDMNRYWGWPEAAICSESLCRRLAKIEDPFLALLGKLTCGGATTDGIMLPAPDFVHAESLRGIFGNMSSNGSPAVWRLRAAFWSEPRTDRAGICEQALGDPEHMSYLQRIFEYPMNIQDRRTSPHRALYHLHLDSGHWASFLTPRIPLGDQVPVILALLALPNTQAVATLRFSGGKVHPQSIERIMAMCEAVKRDPATVLALIMDIAHSIASRLRVHPEDLAALLESTDQAISTSDLCTCTHLLLPLSRIFQNITEMMDRARDATKAVAHHSYLICRRLEVKITMSYISSPSQLQMVSCTRTCAHGQPGLGWLPMYIEA